MAETQHTPGDWKSLGRDGIWSELPDGKGERFIADIGGSGTGEPEAVANGYLLAAAPDLLAALESMLERYRITDPPVCPECEMDDCNLERQVREAVKLAKGA